MATIDVHSEPGLDITTFVVRGMLTAAEIINAIQTEYAQTPTANILWDLSLGALDPRITADEFRRVAAVAKSTRLQSPGARTAYVGSEDLDFGLMRMYSALADEAGVRVEYEVFRDRTAALAWLGGPRPH